MVCRGVCWSLRAPPTAYRSCVTYHDAALRASSRQPSAVSCHPRLVAVVSQLSSVAVACEGTSLASTQALQLVCRGVCWSLRAPPTAVSLLRHVPRARHLARHRAGPRPSRATRASSRLSINPRRSLSLASSLDSLRLGRFDWSVAASVGLFARRQLRSRSFVTCHEHGASRVIAPALGRLLSPAPRRGCQSTLVGRCRLRGHFTRFDSGASIGLSRRLLVSSRAANCGVAPASRATSTAPRDAIAPALGRVV